MNKIRYENNFDKAEKAILKACDNSIKESEHFLKDRLRRIINVKFNKITGTLLKSVQSRINFSEKVIRKVYVGISKDAFYGLFLDKGTGIRRHKKTGKSVGKLPQTRFIRSFYRENKEAVEAIISKYFKRIWYHDQFNISN